MNTANVRYAGFPKRLAAFALDYLVILGYLVSLTLISVGLAYVVELPQPIVTVLTTPLVADGLTFLIVVLPVILYFTLQESSLAQATWGKRKLGLRVINVNGERLSRTRAFVRSLV